MIQKLRRLLGWEGYEEALRNFSTIVEESELLKSEIDLMAAEYIGASNDLSKWLLDEKEPEVQTLIKSQQSGLTSRYLSFLSDKQKSYKKYAADKKAYIQKYPEFEKALADLKKSDFLEQTLERYRSSELTLDEATTIIKAVTKEKVNYADNIVFNQNGEILIEQRGPLDTTGPNLWCLPGGHVNMGEAYEAAAMRELWEETGYQVDDIWQVGEHDDDKCHIQYYTSMVDTDEQSPIVDANETRNTAFVPVSKLYDYPTIFNMWDRVYEILGLDENIVRVKKAIAEGIIKGASKLIGDAQIDSIFKGCGDVPEGKKKKKKKFKEVMDKWKSGALHSGSKEGEKVTSQAQAQAIAIAMSETGQSNQKGIEDEFEKAQNNEDLKDLDDAGILRTAVTAEFDAINLYEQLAKNAKDEKLKKLFADIVKEEKTHVGEFEALLTEVDKEQSHELKSGEKEEKKVEIEKAEFIRTKWPEGTTEFEKARTLGHLIPKKVQVKDKSGKVHLAIRWVNPNSGESEHFASGMKENKRITGATIEDIVAGIVDSDLSRADKVRNLIDCGVYDPKLLTLLTGETYPQKALQQADINLKDLPDNSEAIVTEVRKEQGVTDTPEGREASMLMRDPADIAVLWAKYKLNIKTVLKGNHKLCVAYGTGGVGKTWNCMNVVENFSPPGEEGFKLRRFNKEIQPDHDQYDYVVVKGRISVVQVYAEMYRHRDKIIIFDDCDSFMKEQDVQGFLKGGLDTGKDCEISNLTGRAIYNIQGDPDSGQIPDTFKFKGGVICITNLELGDIKEKAILTRALLNNLSMITDETLRMIAEFKDTMEIYSADKATVVFVSQENRDLAFNMLTEQKDSLSGGDVNGRMYSNMALQAQEADDDGIDQATKVKMVQLYIDSVADKFTKQMRAAALQTKMNQIYNQKIQSQQAKSR
jgi:8-oxo-dGTP pyrophosphatase MutT (NUDIX family)